MYLAGCAEVVDTNQNEVRDSVNNPIPSMKTAYVGTARWFIQAALV